MSLVIVSVFLTIGFFFFFVSFSWKSHFAGHAGLCFRC
uniref:Uncharacterized protein n=1 Tax=Musa acuminata subsp. malaccensis TaxID=214687 RepID=A0A804IHK8_MUSAM